MANSATPYRRLGANSWQELLDQVNAELQNPPPNTDCDPITPIETPPPMHRWAKSDIREVHDRLNQMPTNCFTFQPIPELWKVSIIDDIENQLANSWCDCEGGEKCCQPCSNAANEIIQFLGSTNGYYGCANCSDTDLVCTDAGPLAPCQGTNCSSLPEPKEAFDSYKNNRTQFCLVDQQIREIEDDIVIIEQFLLDLQDLRETCLETSDPGACLPAIDEQIADNEELLAEKEAELALLEPDRDMYEADAISDLADTISRSQTLKQCYSNCCSDHGCLVCFIDEVPTENPGIDPTEDGCADEVTCPEDFIDCCGGCWATCFTTWILQSRIDSGSWIEHYSGAYTSGGQLLVFDTEAADCACVGQFGCCCTMGGSPCPGCFEDGGGICPGGSQVQEWRVRVNPPDSFDPFDCEDGNPCDGERPPEEPPAV